MHEFEFWDTGMFKVITVEREYGAGGSLVAAELARHKGWQFLDKQLTCEIAKLAAVDDKVVARHEEKCDQLMHQLAKVFWRGSYERALPVDPNKIFDTDMLVEFAQRVIERKGEEGNCVIVGRGAPWFLRNRRDTFRVFIYGSRQEKIRRMVRLNMDEKEAIKMVDTIDRERASFIRKYFNAEWPVGWLYHMMLNSDSGIEIVTETILAAMHRLEARAKHSTLPPDSAGIGISAHSR